MRRTVLLAGLALASAAAVAAVLPDDAEEPGDPAAPAAPAPRAALAPESPPPATTPLASTSPAAPPATSPEEPSFDEPMLPATLTPREALRLGAIVEDSLAGDPRSERLVAELAQGLAGGEFTETEAHLALRLLSRIPGPAAEAVLVAVMTDGWTTPRCRRLAVLALGEAGGRTAVGALFDRAAGAADPEDLRLAAQSLVRIARREGDRLLLSELRSRIEPRLLALLPAARAAGDEDWLEDLLATVAELRGDPDPDALLAELGG